MAASKPMKVAVLDDYHNLSSPYLSSFQSSNTIDVTVFTDTLASEPDPQPLIDRLKPFEIILTMRERTRFTAEVIKSLAKSNGGQLRVLMTTGMRNQGIDYEACKEAGVVLTGTPGKGSPEGTPSSFNPTVQHTIALMLALASNIPRDNSLIPNGQWLHALPLNLFLGGKTLSLLGLGRLGKGVARIAKLGFGMKIVSWSENLNQEKADQAALEIGLEKGDIESVTKEELFRRADILSILVVLSERTRGIVKKQDLEIMKSSAMLINTSRGPIVNEEDLLGCLEKGRIRGAAIDVFDQEPIPLDSKWRTTEWGKDGRSQVVLTPHAGYAYEGDTGMGAMWEGLKEELGRVIAGEDVKWRLA